MSSEQDKRPSLVPLGVFGSTPTALPSPPASTTSAGAVPAPPRQPLPPAQPPPARPPAPSAASPTQGSRPPADRPSFPKTLVGVSTALSPEAARASRGDFPAPPKWQGAGAYAAGAPPLRTSSGGPLPPGAQPPPAPSSSALSAGAQPPSPFPLAKDVPALGRANPRTASVSVAPVQSVAPPAAAPPRADDTEEELDLFDAIEEPAPVAPRPAPARASARPAQSARPQPESTVGEPAPAQPVTRSSIPPVIVPDFARKDPSEVNIALPAPAPVLAPAPAPVPAAVKPIAAPAPAPRLAPVVAATPRARVEVDPGAPLLGVIFVAAMLIIGVGGWWLTRGGFVRARHPETAASALPAARKPAPTSSAPPALAPVAAPPAEAPVAVPAAEPAVEAAVEPPAEEAPPEPADEPAVEPEPTPRSGTRRAESARRAPRPPPPPARTDAPPPLTITPQVQARAPVSGAVMPDTPTREDVTRALDAVRAQVSACTAGKHGVAEVDLTVLSAGDVSHVVVTGDFAGTPEGSCIAREVRAARFSPFLKPRFRLIYPFQL